jgi:hypothetical protein
LLSVVYPYYTDGWLFVKRHLLLSSRIRNKT